MIIYKARNILNNKIYIGKSKLKLEERRNDHIYASEHESPYAFHRAIRKHSFHNFHWEILKKGINSEQVLNKFEKFFIKKFKSKSPIGYNMTDGGDGFSNPCTEVREKRISSYIERCKNPTEKMISAWKDGGRKNAEKWKDGPTKKMISGRKKSAIKQSIAQENPSQKIIDGWKKTGDAISKHMEAPTEAMLEGRRKAAATFSKICKDPKRNQKILDGYKKASEKTKGKKLTEEHKLNISKGKKGKPTWIKGQKLSVRLADVYKRGWEKRRLKKEGKDAGTISE